VKRPSNRILASSKLSTAQTLRKRSQTPDRAPSHVGGSSPHWPAFTPLRWPGFSPPLTSAASAWKALSRRWAAELLMSIGRGSTTAFGLRRKTPGPARTRRDLSRPQRLQNRPLSGLLGESPFEAMSARVRAAHPSSQRPVRRVVEPD
jgi:hypothetical protein